ncbi:amidase [Paraburkholderia unamae]|uniref:Amidase n=1 Tax=Paraburkholderia unamae TaxID=219649 RepID=A0ABX5K9H0_9BURK|nr:amidase [Paraburkholderia unamae]PVX71404.1 amidase [Paraburkholderia unamae]
MPDRRAFLRISGAAASAAMLPAAAEANGTAAAALPNDPAWLPATALLSRFRRRELSPVDVLEAQIKRIEAWNDKVNCITTRHYDEARAAARESAARYRNGNPRALEGITVAVKDEYAVKGWVTTMGSLLLKDAPPATDDGPVIERLRAAGAVFHIETTVPEFYVWMTTATTLWGVTRNPWNLAWTPGGSSGGSGAALAAGFTTLALGSDMGGSIRIPASQCGLYGFKPPFGRVPTSEVPYESEGPMARTFDDLNLLTNAMVGPHPLVHSSLRPRLAFPSRYAPVKGWKIAYDPMPHLSPLDPPVRAAMERAVTRFEQLGVEVERVDIGFDSADMDTFMTGLFSTSMGGLRTEALKDPGKLMPYTRMLFEHMEGKTGPDALVATEALLNDYQRRVQEKVFTRGLRALVMPTLATPLIPAAHGLNPQTDTVTIDGKPVTGLRFAQTWVWNLLGFYPVVPAPIGIGPGGMPMGMQIVANTFDDLDAFQLASAWSGVAPPLFTGSAFPDFRAQNG